MARILITSGPTRQYLDPVRYLSNASSGRMGQALTEAALAAGHEVIVVSGPVEINYPEAAQLIPVVSTEEMLAACQEIFPRCDGLIGVAAPCDYRPVKVEPRKIHRSGEPLVLELHETPDIVATLGASKRPDQWLVGFALETEDHRFRAVTKLEKKSCDLIILNSPSAIGAADNSVEILDRTGKVIAALTGSKVDVARGVFQIIERDLIRRSPANETSSR
jgi:phosphopantothenoylcysteine decarboxylase/phosphopantothenate--cysteine ligase